MVAIMNVNYKAFITFRSPFTIPPEIFGSNEKLHWADGNFSAYKEAQKNTSSDCDRLFGLWFNFCV